MELIETIKKRRAYRSFEPITITKEIVKDLAESAQLSASCFNNQPWRYVFVYEKEQLKKMHETLSGGNQWAEKASMIIAVLGKKDDDCVLKDGREYYLFDIGMATAHLILRATEMDLVAHPIAGYNIQKVREVLNIPDDISVVTLIIVGRHSQNISPILSEKQVEWEKKRPERVDLNKIMFIDRYKE